MTYCQCCRTRPGSPLQLAKGRTRLPVRATLCHQCATETHYAAACLLCVVPRQLWKCGWVSHFAEAHPGVLAKLAHDPLPELAAPKPTMTKLGTLRLPGRN